MKTKSINLVLTTMILCSVLLFSSFAKNDVNAQSNSGISNAIPSYYDGKPFTIIFVEFSSQAEQSLIAHSSSRNFIYRCDELPGFISVLDAIPGDGMNAVWQEVQIHFLTISPQQFLSDNDVLAAASAGHISLEFTSEVYTCPIIGKKPK
jgi:hypothetical protein